MNAKPSKIVVAGDVTIDWLEYPVKAKDSAKRNWQLVPGYRMVAASGGAVLLARLVGAAAGTKPRTYDLPNLESIPPDDVLHSMVRLKVCPSVFQKNKSIYRVDHLCGFSGPSRGMGKTLLLDQDDPKCSIVVLDDAGNGFRDKPDAWPKALSATGGKPIIAMKMSRPLAEGKLWDHLRRNHSDRLAVVVSADDLRAEGVNICRYLSWERTAADFVGQMEAHPMLKALSQCAHLIVRLGIDGAIHYARGTGGPTFRLYYDPSGVEDGFYSCCDGRMLGYNSTFVASLVRHVVHGGLSAIGDGIEEGVKRSRRLLQLGFGDVSADPDYPVGKIFSTSKEVPAPISNTLIPKSSLPADQQSWSILKDLKRSELEEVAYSIVELGEGRALKNLPVAQFGKFKTADRTEIESYRSIMILMDEYLKPKTAKRPLSIGVFGPPGSGKSFGVTQIAETIAGDGVETTAFNVAQFKTADDLVRAFHQIHDIGLGGKVPLVFFDEFDSEFNGELGWLKYFLAPMQDGEFKDGEANHPIGRAIFVFAGGTSTSFRKFCREDEESQPKADMFRERKGPDFVSRLRGYVDILGPNPVSDDDNFAMIRRAITLRSLIERTRGHLLDSKRIARIDRCVQRAFIKVPQYKHAVRSMEALLDMSSLADHKSFEQAALPPISQLNVHVDARMFTLLVAQDALFGAAREKLGRAFHEHYLRNVKDKPPEHPSMQPWNVLREDLKESNRLQADDIPAKLKQFKYWLMPMPGEPPEKRFQFDADQVELLAKREHERWVAEKASNGWTYGPVRDETNKIHPCLVDWDDPELKDEEKQKDRNSVIAIPEILESAGFEIYRLP